MKLAKSLKDWSQGLSRRETIIITVATSLIVITSVMLSLEPIWRDHHQLKVSFAAREEDLNWLNEQAKSVSKLGNDCAGRTIKNGSDREILNLILRRNQLRPKVNKEDRGSYFLEFEVDDSNKVLKMISHLACEQFALETLLIDSLQNDENFARYVAKIELSRVR
ncbi:MAG: hypothetical protein CBC09_00870 [Cellvibrionales bacterium TMED49]|nr:hypothetical protein [Porticoccaceae bacterium]OUU40098.1 MAG: hypothetical protein CBC09_00870 [Cellvibrionales bacterium TMED49]|tara:strand:+ start:322 stop:816 length:495 start_codon:yes stop_codon:yes gene_type:complete